MYRRMLGAAFAFAACLSVPALAADPSDVVTVVAPAPGTTTPTPAATDPNDTIVCRNIPPPLGTRIGGRRECATRREWQAQEDSARTMMHDAQNKPWINPGSGKDNLPPMGGH